MATKTVGSGGDYATFAAWAAYANSLSSLSADEICHVIGQVNDSAAITLNANPSGSFKIRVRPAPGYEIAPGSRLFPGISGRARLVNSVDYATCYTISTSKVLFEGIEVESTAANATTFNLSNGGRIDRCIIKSASNAVTCDAGSSTSSGVYSCAIFAVGRAIQSSVAWYFDAQGNTIVGGTLGLRSEYDNCISAKNNVVYGAGTAFYGTLSNGSSHNAHSGGTTPGTGWTTNVQTNVSSADFVSTTGGSEDYRRSPTSTKLGNTGTTAGISVDIYNQTRTGQGTAYDIGAYEYPEAVTSGSVSGGATLANFSASGGFLSVASLMSGGATLADFITSGTLGPAPGVITSPSFRNWAGSLLANTTIPKVTVIRVSDMATVLNLTNRVTNASGILQITDLALTPGVKYLVVTCNADGSAFGCEPMIAG